MNKIPDHLISIEKSLNISILYACEAGSRSFGTHSIVSDYDVRFIFVQPLKEYLQIKQARDVYTAKTNGIEFHGWDLFKTMRLFQKSNPTLYEWMYSQIVYINKDGFGEKLQAMIAKQYSLQTIAKHYHSLMKGNIQGVSKLDSPLNQVKAMIQAVRGLLSVKWMMKFHTFPPLSYAILIEGSNYSVEQKRLFQELVTMKLQNVQNQLILKELIHFLQTENELIEHQVEQLPKQTIKEEICNEFIWSMLRIET